ncbi:MAG: hypothetical protein JRH10_02095 [Deltaproteobacteria bacterium]|nr:hypothetical protein [Deltaproteobacteria bacterium]
MSDLCVNYEEDELLESGSYSEPLIAGGVRCHGGFDEVGEYRSPRTTHRAPAILAWQEQLRRDGHGLIEVDAALMPPQYPNVEQAKLLLREGVNEPIVRALTIISIVEGFGAIIRDVPVPKLDSMIVEPIAGTALAHLDKGLFEAHARDEAGHRDQGGHKQMWEAARDLALEDPKIPNDVLMRIMGRRAKRERRRLAPELDVELERMLNTMATVLAVEIFARSIFDWGERLLSDPEVSAEPKRAGDMVRFIRADESPHVEYLRTALSEVAARTLRTASGGTMAGREIVDRLMHANLHALTTQRPKENRSDVREGLTAAIERAGGSADLVEQLDALEVTWTPPAATGFEPATEAGSSAASA